MLYQFAIIVLFFLERCKGKSIFYTGKYLKEKMMKKYHFDKMHAKNCLIVICEAIGERLCLV